MRQQEACAGARVSGRESQSYRCLVPSDPSTHSHGVRESLFITFIVFVARRSRPRHRSIRYHTVLRSRIKDSYLVYRIRSGRGRIGAGRQRGRGKRSTMHTTEAKDEARTRQRDSRANVDPRPCPGQMRFSGPVPSLVPSRACVLPIGWSDGHVHVHVGTYPD